jgi:hypothetical protein
MTQQSAAATRHVDSEGGSEQPDLCADRCADAGDQGMGKGQVDTLSLQARVRFFSFMGRYA